MLRPEAAYPQSHHRLDVSRSTSPVTSIVAVIVAIIGFALGYALGRARRADALGTAPFAIAEAPAAVQQAEAPTPVEAPAPIAAPRETASAAAVPDAAMPAPSPPVPADERTTVERARIIRSYEAEAAMLRHVVAGRDAAIEQLTDLAEERRRLFDDLAAARSETARYRQLVVDLENNAAPQFFGAGAPDDLKLIVGIGPVLERMLQMMGVTTYRQIARWSERDIDEFDAKLHEFPGRIRRDAWVTQARALHQSKYGETLPLRGRG
jgi:predicted flap endonuclease-1-like 5' DNA nuclease